MAKKVRLSFTTFLALFICGVCVAQQYNPVANPSAVVNSGNARFTILTDRVIRVEYAGDTVFNDLASLTFVNRNLPVPVFSTSHENGQVKIKTMFLTLAYNEGAGRFNAGNLKIEYADGQHHFTWKPGMKDHRNLKGTTRTLDGTSGNYSFQTLKNIDLGDGILSRSGWALVDDSQKPVFDNSEWPWVQNSATPNNTDWYFFGYGSDYKAALFDFTSVSGKISLPPKFAFGIWYSRYAKYTEQDFKDVVTGYEKNNIPLDVLVIDMDWHQTSLSNPELFSKFNPKPDGWTGFTWEKKYFPDYRRFLQWTNDKKLHTCLNLHPAAGVQPHEFCFNQFANAMGLDSNAKTCIPFDITNKLFAKNYFDVLLHPYEKDGVDFWWLDWQQFSTTGIKGVNPTFYLNYVHFSDMLRQGKRPLIFHRYGGLGNQRYQIGFSGDVFINWKSLRYQPGFTATAANVGFGFWSHDIGGHMNPVSKAPKQDAELFTRWVQWGAFSPIFRTHCTDDAEIERRVWNYPTPNFEAMKKAMLLRYSLIPYIYANARFAYDSGISLIRPMYYEYPETEEAYKHAGQYFFGSQMIVAPVCESMHGKPAVGQSVWLPDGKWYDLRNNELVSGGTTVTRFYALDETPVFIKQGSIIPTQPQKQHADDVLDTIILSVYTGANGNFRLYEDDGSTDNYRSGNYSFTNISFKQDKGTMQLNIVPDGQQFNGQLKQRVWEFRFINCAKPASVSVNGGAQMARTYDSNSHILYVQGQSFRANEILLLNIE